MLRTSHMLILVATDCRYNETCVVTLMSCNGECKGKLLVLCPLKYNKIILFVN